MINKTGAELIADERQRQIEKEGYDEAHDKQYKTSALGYAGICYALMAGSSPKMREAIRKQCDAGYPPQGWPWDKEHWKPCSGDTDAERIKELTKAGALIAAEIDRIHRKSNSKH